MTLSTITNKTPHVGNGVLTNFSYLFRVDDADHMKVYLDSEEKLTGITVNNVGNDAGGTVDLDVAPANGVRVTLLREVPLKQETDYQPYDPFPAESHEGALDTLTMITQQLEEVFDRTLSVPPGSDPNVDYTAPEYDAGKAIMWDEGTQTLRNSTDQFDNVVSLATAAQAAAETAKTLSEAARDASQTYSLTAEGHMNKAEEWASRDDGVMVDGDYSAWEYAIGTTVPAGSAKHWSEEANIWAQGAKDLPSGGGASARIWATWTGDEVATGSGQYSAQEWAIGTTVPDGSAKSHADDAHTYRDEVYAFPSTSNVWSAVQTYASTVKNPTGTAVTIDFANEPWHRWGIDNNVTVTFSNLAGDRSCLLEIWNASGSGHTITWPANTKWMDTSAKNGPASGDVKIIHLWSNSSAGSVYASVVWEGGV